MPELSGGNEPVTIESGFTLEAPDLVGTVEVVDAAGACAVGRAGRAGAEPLRRTHR